ncbi:NepR family anti-sigma factor [Methylocystis borbori]|uniref:NepR family anti-sigma factor n=1 Tax=Methylocystis borbori TaxID=3118750 RepID=UPI0038CBFE04
MSAVPSPSQKVADEVGKQLREHYDEVLREPLPEMMLALLDKLQMDKALHYESSDPSTPGLFSRRTMR